MRLFIAIRLIFLSMLACLLVVVMLPAMIFGGTKFLREVYQVLEREFAKLRVLKKAA